MVEFLTLLALKVYEGNPGVQTPAAEHYELELDLEDATELLESHFAWAEARGKGEASGVSGTGDSGVRAKGGEPEVL